VTPLQPALAAGFLLPLTLCRQPTNFFASNLQTIGTFPTDGLAKLNLPMAQVYCSVYLELLIKPLITNASTVSK